MSNLLPQFQEAIDTAYEGLNLSDERRAVLQPEVEKNVHIVKVSDDDGSNPRIEMQIVNQDKEKTKRKDINISQLVKEVHEKTGEKDTPVVNHDDAMNLSDQQLKDVASGKLQIDMNTKKVVVKDAIPGSEVLDRNLNLDDVASGKTKIDIDS